MAAEKWFCLVDVKYYEEDTYVPRHNKMILHISDFAEAYDYIHNYYGDNIEDIHMWWAGQHDRDCKEELVFTESEFAAFDMVKNIIENDHSYEDYKKAVKKHEKSK